MPSVFLLLAFLAVCFAYAPVCPAVACTTSSSATCFTYSLLGTSATATANACPSGYSCPVMSLNSGNANTSYTCTLNTYTAAFLVAGSPCNATFLCANTCGSDGYCVGLGKGAACTSTPQCDIGLFCNSGACSSLLPNGAKCTDKFSCDYGSECLNNTCTALFSLPNYTSLGNSANAGFCISGAVYNMGTVALPDYMCIPALESSSAVPTKCSQDSDCVSKAITYNGKPITLQGTCGCGFGLTPQVYCSTFPGDTYPTKVLGLIKSWVVSNALRNYCGIQAMYGGYCMLRNWGKKNYYSFLYYDWMKENQFKITNVNACLKTALLMDYESIYKEFSDQSDSKVFALASVVLGLVIA
jgi:hypothetical protein